MHHIKEIKPEDTYSIRLQVLKTNEKYQYKYQGDFDKTTKHLGIYDAKKLIGIVTIIQNMHPDLQKDAIQLRGMAILPEFQKKGIGKLLIQEVEKNYAHQKLIWCNARDYAVGFYKSLGFVTFGEKFYIKNVCNHFTMYKYLNETC